jgi:hypothetical protein
LYRINYKQAISRLSLIAEAMLISCLGTEMTLLPKYAEDKLSFIITNLSPLLFTMYGVPNPSRLFSHIT